MRRISELFMALLALLGWGAAPAQAAGQSLNPWIASKNFVKGEQAMQQQNLEKALSYLHKEVNDHPDNYSAWADIAIIAATAGDTTLAFQAVNQAIATVNAQDTASASHNFYVRGKLRSFAGDTARALADYDQAIALNPADVSRYNTRGSLLYDSGDYARALQDFLTMTRLDPADATGFVEAGLASTQLGQQEQAAHYYSQAIALQPGNPVFHCFRGMAWQALGRDQEAVNDYITTLTGDPYDDDAQQGLIEIAKRNRQLVVSQLRARLQTDNATVFQSLLERLR